MFSRIAVCPAPLRSSLLGEGDEGEEDERDIEAMELPPLDSDEESDGERDPDATDSPIDLGADDEDGLDDSVADDLDDGVRLGDDELPMEASDREAADDAIDVGSLDEGIDLGEEAPIEDDRAEGDGAEADDDDLELAEDGDDGGVEGTTDDPEDDIDETLLPALDADDDGFGDEGALAAELLDDAGSPATDASSWSMLEGAGAGVPCSAVVASSGHVVASGEALLVVSDGLRAVQRASEAGPISAIAVDGDLLAFAMRRGPLRVSVDLGLTSNELAGFGARGKGREGDAIELAASAGRIWILEGGALWSLTVAADRAAMPVRKTGVRRIAATGGALVILARLEDGGLAVERLRGDDERWPVVRLAGDAAAISASGDVRFAAALGGAALALADSTKVTVSRDGGRTFETTALPGVAALTFASDVSDAPLFALLEPDRDGTSALLSLDADGRATHLARLAGARAPISRDLPDTEAEAGVPLGLAWDAARELVWVASAAGLTAFARAAHH